MNDILDPHSNNKECGEGAVDSHQGSPPAWVQIAMTLFNAVS